MQIGILSFTPTGYETAQKISKILKYQHHSVIQTVKCAGIPSSYEGTLKEWTKEQFAVKDAIIYVGATGIAVRAIAPYVVSKKEDPAVLVVDERGQYCIPILSGHIGGGNELALMVSEGIGAMPIITTATDINGKWAVDVFATKNQLYISDMEKAKAISAAILQGQKIKVWMDEGISIVGNVPEELEIVSVGQMLRGDTKCAEDCMEECVETGDAQKKQFSVRIHGIGKDSAVPDIYIGIRVLPETCNTLQLIPQTVLLGIGCRKKTEESTITRHAERVLKEHSILNQAVEKVASIDLKANEKGLCAFCEHHRFPLVTYTADELSQVQGDFTASAFVRQVTGIDNVCERSALYAGGDHLLVRKVAEDGVTVAVAVKKLEVKF